MKEVIAGDYGDKWKKLIEVYPSGTVDIHAELFMCPKCENWKNDYNMSFYTLDDQYTTKVKRVFLLDSYSLPEYADTISGIQSLINKYHNHYHLHKEYCHLCSRCGAQMIRIPLRKDLWIDTLKLEKLELKCPYCSQTIQLSRGDE